MKHFSENIDRINVSGVGLGVAGFLGGVGVGAGAASKKIQINFLENF